MFKQKKDYDKTLTRLILILKKLSLGEMPTIYELSQEFNVSIRTIQRDIYTRLYHFPIEKIGKKLKFIDGFSLENCSLEDDEMLLVYLAMSQVKNISHSFESNIDNIFSKLLHPGFQSAYFIKSKQFEDLQKYSKLVKNIENSIEKSKMSQFMYHNNIVNVRPYKIVSLRGLWYLLAKDMYDVKIKVYLLSEVNNYKLTSTVFKMEINIDTVLDGVHSGWFMDGENIHIKVKVNSNISKYFKLKNVFPKQKILEEYSDGSIDVQFDVSHYEDLDNIIKSWLPDIKVIEPVHYKEKLENELKSYLK